MKKLIFLLLLFGSIRLSAQSSYPNAVESIIPPSPTVAALAKIIETPMDYYTGIPKIEIPLYTINEGDI